MMIRVVIVDDHPALRAGLHTVLDSEPGIVFAGESTGEEEHVWPVLHRSRPDFVLLDYHLPRGDGLQLCYRIKQDVPTPKVVLYTAYASPTLALPARLARADGIVDKGIGARELFDAIRRVHAGEHLVPPVSRTVMEEGARKLEPEQRALLGMLLDGASEREAAQTLRVAARDVRHSVQRILSTLRLEVPAGGFG
jgi:DNA-binding NarL/FixJ family response regulator